MRSVLAPLVVLLLAGCGDDGTPRSSATPQPSVTSPTAAASTPAPSGTCTTGQLRVTLGTSGAAAGTGYQQLVLQNTGTTTCGLTGYLGITFETTDGRTVGLPAEPTNVTGAPVTAVRLAPGGYATAAVGLPDTSSLDASACAPQTGAFLRVRAPQQADGVQVAFRAEVCTAGQGRPLTTPVRAGRSSTPVA